NQFIVKVQDTKAPTLTVPGPMTVQATSGAGAPVKFDVTAVDAVTENLTVRCSVGDQPVASGAVFPLGKRTVECSATDEAGNTGTATFTVEVSVGWGGFLQPLNPGGPATFKLNSTIPVKFQLAGASAGIANLDARLYVRRVGGSEFAATSTSGATTGNAFRWDADGRQYIFNLNTKALQVAGMYELRVDLGDGVPHTIEVEIRK
ncbi:MAG TPA: PxKF domain-containing protein, partial [Micromonospora sp.]|nr:PxKF domain-containing protein [Micromonospora sp.]